MEYAVIRTGGKQYRVKEGDILEVDKLSVDKDKQVTFEDVLLWVSDPSARASTELSRMSSGQAGRKVMIGTPTLSDVKVKAKVLDQIKGEKIRVAKFKAKVRYRRVMGFRPLLTRIQIEKIESGKPQAAKTLATSTAKPATKTEKTSAKRIRSKKKA